MRTAHGPAIASALRDVQDNPRDAEAIYTRLIADMEAFHRDWSAVRTPSAAAAYHHDQLTLLADTIDFERSFLAALRGQDQQGVLDALETGAEINIRSARLKATLDDLLIEALSR